MRRCCTIDLKMKSFCQTISTRKMWGGFHCILNCVIIFRKHDTVQLTSNTIATCTRVRSQVAKLLPACTSIVFPYCLQVLCMRMFERMIVRLLTCMCMFEYSSGTRVRLTCAFKLLVSGTVSWQLLKASSLVLSLHSQLFFARSKKSGLYCVKKSWEWRLGMRLKG